MHATASEFWVGQRIRTNGSYSSPPRYGRIAEIKVNDYGIRIYILQDGGSFSANELHSDELKGTKRPVQDGKRACPHCDTSGIARDDCPNCDGDHHRCSACDQGRVEINCPQCDATGFVCADCLKAPCECYE